MGRKFRKAATGGNARVRGNNSSATGGDAGETVVEPGGDGGNAEVEGNDSRAIGGPGGRGGLGEGGRGGDAVARGEKVLVVGGEGGEANQPDGRGGRGGRSGFHFAGKEDMQLPDGRWLSEFGRGGDGAHSTQYAARLMVIEELLGRQLGMRAESAGLTNVDLEQLNARLRTDNRNWRVRITAGCFEFYEV